MESSSATLKQGGVAIACQSELETWTSSRKVERHILLC